MEDINSKLAAQWQAVLAEQARIADLKDEKIALLETRADVFNTFIADLMERMEAVEKARK